MVLIVSSLILLFASVRVFFHARFAYIMALAASLASLTWLVWTEVSEFRILNSWIMLNLPNEIMGYDVTPFITLRILAVALALVTLFFSGLRLLPKRWTVRKLPVNQRTWPAFAASAAVITFWYASAVSPYRIPVIIDLLPPELTILHVVKRGIHLAETRVALHRDGKLYVARVARRFFQYRFKESEFFGTASSVEVEHALTLVQSFKSQNIQTLRAKKLTAWNAEGWYIMGIGRSVLAFTSEYGTEPPREIVALFQELDNAPATEGPGSDVKDVCLGFCYDPLAALGFASINYRCRGTGHSYC